MLQGKPLSDYAVLSQFEVLSGSANITFAVVYDTGSGLVNKRVKLDDIIALAKENIKVSRQEYELASNTTVDPNLIQKKILLLFMNDGEVPEDAMLGYSFDTGTGTFTMNGYGDCTGAKVTIILTTA